MLKKCTKMDFPKSSQDRKSVNSWRDSRYNTKFKIEESTYDIFNFKNKKSRKKSENKLSKRFSKTRVRFKPSKVSEIAAPHQINHNIFHYNFKIYMYIYFKSEQNRKQY